MLLSREALAWAAGFVDGEGNFRMNEYKYIRRKQHYGGCHFSVAQIDRQVLDRLQKALGGLGKVYGPYHPKSKKNRQQPYYVFASAAFEQFQAIVAMLWNFLSPVKRAQAKHALLTFHKLNKRKK